MNIHFIYEKFPTERACVEHLEAVRWPDQPVCPYCKASQSTALSKEQRHHCNACNTTFSVTVGTIFHHTHLPLQKWLLAVSLFMQHQSPPSARQLARDLKVNKNTGWRIGNEIRAALANGEQRRLLLGLSLEQVDRIGDVTQPGGTSMFPAST